MQDGMRQRKPAIGHGLRHGGGEAERAQALEIDVDHGGKEPRIRGAQRRPCAAARAIAGIAQLSRNDSRKVQLGRWPWSTMASADAQGSISGRPS